MLIIVVLSPHNSLANGVSVVLHCSAEGVCGQEDHGRTAQAGDAAMGWSFPPALQAFQDILQQVSFSSCLIM